MNGDVKDVTTIDVFPQLPHCYQTKYILINTYKYGVKHFTKSLSGYGFESTTENIVYDENKNKQNFVRLI